MKRRANYSAVALVGIVLACTAIFAMIVLPLQPAPASQMVEGIHFVSDGRSTIAMVPVADNPGTAILFTHGHSDHIRGAKQFPHAQLMALPADAALISGLVGAQGPLTRLFPVSPTGLKVDRVLQYGETLLVAQTKVKVFAVPGHTMGSAAYLINGVLFLGDSANATRSGRLQSAVWLFSDDLRSNQAALRRLDKTLLANDAGEVKAIAFGHSSVLDNGLTPLTEWAVNHQ